MIMANYLKRPAVVKINSDGYQGNPGDLISVSTYDGVKVIGVTLEIIDPGNKVVEEGSCNYNTVTCTYDYKTINQVPGRAGVKLRATVFNIPNHKGTPEVTL